MTPPSPFRARPSRRPETLGEIAELVRRCHRDIGFAQDPDGDRLAVIDETGFVLDNDDVLALAVDAALRRLPGDVVVNLTTSSVIDDVAAAHGRRVYRTPVGEANVVETMQAVNAVIGGEGSNGGIIFPAVHLCRDSYTGMAFLLDRMAETGETISTLAARLPKYYRTIRKGGLPARAARAADAKPGDAVPARGKRPLRRPEAVCCPTAGSTCARQIPNRCCEWRRRRRAMRGRRSCTVAS